MKFIDSARFTASSFSNLFENFRAGIHKIKCKDFDCFLEYESVKEISIKYKYLSCNKGYSKKINKELKSSIKSTFYLFVVKKWCLSL